MAIKTYNGVTYDDSVDYSAAIEQAEKSGQDTTQLEASRNAKIADKYKGVEPVMYGSNKTYSQAKNDTSASTRQEIDNAVKTSSQINGYDYTAPSNVSFNKSDYFAPQYSKQQGVHAFPTNAAYANQLIEYAPGEYVKYDSTGKPIKMYRTDMDPDPVGAYTTHSNDTIYHQLAYQAAEKGEWEKVGQYLNMMSDAYARTGPNDGYTTGVSGAPANYYQAELQRQFQYDDETYYNHLYDQAYGENASAVYDATNGAIKTYADLEKAVGADKAKEIVEKQIASKPNVYNNPGSLIAGTPNVQIPNISTGVPTLPGIGGSSGTGMPSVNGGNVSGNISISGGSGSYKPGSLGDYLDDWLAAAQQQQTNTVDYGTNQAVLDLIRQQQDAEATFQEQRNQIAIDEAKAKDNQALYAEARGDKGGIGAAQYDSIMNTAAQNRLQVNSAQQKLATDTARQIADLRAQGEYEKADALLSLSQQYLAQLINLEQWSMEYNLSVAQFNASLQQWEAEYKMAVADLTGYYNGTPTLKNQQYQNELALTQQNQMASAGETLLSAGIMPSASQLAAMGITSDQAQSMITAAQLAATQKNSDGGNPSTADIDGLFEDALKQDSPWTWIKSNYKKYGLTAQPDKSEFEAYQSENTYSEDDVSATAKAWYTDLYKLYGSQEDRLNAIIKEYNNGNSWMTNADRLWLLDKLQLR